MTQNPKSTSAQLRLLAAALTAAPLLVACGGGGGSDPAPVPLPAVTAAAAGPAMYGRPLLLTVNGSNLDQPMTVTSTGCTTITRSTTAPNISTASTAYYTCTVNAVGAQQFAVLRGSDNANLASAAYTVPVPQVTMTVSNGAAVNGSFVITLAPQQAPITVNNFLNYVNSGFYNGSIFHRLLPTFVMQAGGYDAGVVANAMPVHKPTNAAITLEDNAGLSNTNLTVSMARTSVPDSGTSEFFINLADNLGLNRTATTRGYAVFGSVTTGAPVVTAMKAAPCVAALVSECLPIPNLVITSAVQTQ
jgi:peptidyl-prolyl cis-trans isomerase A (cyclophilin A)